MHAPQRQPEVVKKRLNVDSPTFTPSGLASSGLGKQIRSRTMSPKAVNAAPFTPKKLNPSAANPFVLSDVTNSSWTPSEVQDFVPQNFDGLSMADAGSATANLGIYESYGAGPGSLADLSGTNGQTQVNPYTQDASGLPSSGEMFYQGQSGFAQPLQYHLYAPLGPHRENLLSYQRTVHDMFIPDALREELQRKAEASLQVLPNSSLPSQVDDFHSLVPLDTTNQKNATIFGYPSWVYKAVSTKDGKVYALRRLEGYRLTNEKSIRSVQAWKRVDNANVVTIHDAFTTGAFGDRSLIFVTDYHPLSKTLAEHYFGPGARFASRMSGGQTSEQVLWSYCVQMASALKTIHGMGLAARLVDLSKVLLTSKGRVRLNGCAVLDVVNYDVQVNAADLQQEDLLQFGRLMLALASNSAVMAHHAPKSMDFLSRAYSTEFKDAVLWLLSPAPAKAPAKTIDQFLQGIAGQVTTSLNHALQHDDQLQSELMRELENGRLVRLMAKLNFINERPEFDHDRQWSETGDRYLLKLFRDHVFHQVEPASGTQSAGNNNHSSTAGGGTNAAAAPPGSATVPVVDLGHVITCLNKLDAGVDEKVTLVSRDEQNCLVVSYRELKRGVDNAFQDLVRAASRAGTATVAGAGASSVGMGQVGGLHLHQ